MTKNTNKPKSQNTENRWIVITVCEVIVLVFIGVLSVVFVKNCIAKGVSSANTSFLDTYSDTKTETDEIFEALAEKYKHVQNDVTISISAVKEKSALEVLKISDVVYIISDTDDTKSGTTSWLKVYGTGIFTVDLKGAEYIVDNSRHYVLVRAPMPELNSKNISIDSFETLYYSENKWTSSNSVANGEKLAKAQLSEAQKQIQEDFKSTESYEKLAESSASSMIISLIKSLNSDIEDLAVEVEFY